MNTAAIEKFSVWARTALREGVILRAERYRLFGDDAPAADELIEVAGRAITEAERSQRAALLRRVREAGQDAFVEQMAALWFNRLVAIRYMEVRDFLPSRTRIFSDAEGRPRSQALAEAASLDLPGLDRAQVLELKAAGTDEPLFRQILLAQCAQLAEALPRVFSALDAADALMLPDNLLAPGSVCRRLVEDLPDTEWETVEVIGWAYQFYNAEVKDEVFAGFKKKRKAETVAQIGPATQLFTPEWIVRYMVENSLGRLWMLNNPGSALRQRMRYYIEPESSQPRHPERSADAGTQPCHPEHSAETDAQPRHPERSAEGGTQPCHPERSAEAQPCHPERSAGAGTQLCHPERSAEGAESKDLPTTPEPFIRIEGPEDIRVLDPACGSGHILVYAFDLLAAMYEERGYRPRDAARLIVEKNLAGLEIDERAGQLAILALTMKARELDRRFLASGITPDVRVLASVAFTEEELAEVPQLLPYGKELDVLAHLSEAGSLFEPTAEFAAALDDAAASISADDLMTRGLAQKLKLASDQCHALTRTFDVVAANPPYMGSSNFGSWMSKWTKATYPDFKSDLFACSYRRYCSFAKPAGELGFMTPYVWMFIGSYEKMRNDIINNRSITSLVQLEYSGFAGATVPICTFTLTNQYVGGLLGGYVRLADFVGAAVQGPKALEAIQNPDCGYFYRSDATNFKSIPGTPIAYWASDAMISAFANGHSLSGSFEAVVKGVFTGDNARYLREWFEVSSGMVGNDWRLYAKGGAYRRWYGNIEHVIDWSNKEGGLKQYSGAGLGPSKYFDRRKLCWTKISSSITSFRYYGHDVCFDDAAPGFISRNDMKVDALLAILGFLNSTVVLKMLSFIAPTLNYQCGDMKKIPILELDVTDEVSMRVRSNIALSRADWDSLETSWDFKRNPLV